MLRKVMPKFNFEDADARPSARALANTLIEAMHYHGGIGLAANQIGIADRAFAMEHEGQTIVLFNPEITWLAIESIKLNEGCLSFGDLELKISRPRECQVSYLDAEGKRKVIDLKGLSARVALHETDHLDGIVFTSLVSRLKLDMAKKKMEKANKKA